MMKTKTLPVISAILSAAAAVAVNTVLHPCRGDMTMKCMTTTKAGTVLLAVLTVLGAAAFLIKSGKAQKVLAGLSAIGAAAVFFVPALGHCGGAMMHCNTHTMPAFRIAGAVLFVLAVIALAAGFVRKPQADAA